MATLGTMTRDIHNRNNTSGVSIYIDSSDLTAVLGDFSRIMGDSETVLMDALLAGANTVVNAAKVNCPHRTGTLKRSIHPEVDGSSAVIVGTDVSYARYVEQGTYKMDAQPYLLPALTENKDRIIRRVNNAIKRLTSK